MNSTSRLLTASRVAVLIAGFQIGMAVAATGDVARGVAQLEADRVETRTFTLQELGLRTPVALTAPETTREFFLPVPAGVAISDATLQLAGGYVRGDGGRTTMLVSLDGAPVLARSFTQPDGSVAANVGVDGAARDTGYVRVGVGYASVINDNVCADQTAIGNVLRVDPATRFTYRFNPADIRDLRTAWTSLPHAPVLAVAGRHLQAQSFDTAWRVDALLERDSKAPVMQAMPAIGDVVDAGSTVPAELRTVPAFNALSAGPHAIHDEAELGALFAVAPRTVFGPDLIVVDDALRQRVRTALDALRAQVVSTAPDASGPFDAWRARAFAPIVNPLEPGEVRLAHLGGRAVIIVGDDRGASVLTQNWRSVGVADRLIVHTLDTTARAPGDRVRLSDLGGEPRSVDVHDTASWDASFDMAAASEKGKLPTDVVLDLAASPTLSNSGATATVYFNDVMIGAKLLNTDGKRQRIDVPIPHYALARTNTLRVTFRRQPDAGCQARQSYPVAVLPSSHLRLSSGDPDNDFVGMAMRYSNSALVIVPQAYLDNALVSVPRMATLTGAAGVAPFNASLSVAASGTAASPDRPFLAADVALSDEKNHASFSKGRLEVTSASGDPLIDLSGLNKVAVISVATSNGQTGIVFRATGDAPVLTDRLSLPRGDIAMVDEAGELKHVDTVHPDDLEDTNASSTEWVTRHWMRWGIPMLLLVMLLVIVLAARFARRKHRDGS